MLAAGNFPQHRTVCESRRLHREDFTWRWSVWRASWVWRPLRRAGRSRAGRARLDASPTEAPSGRVGAAIPRDSAGHAGTISLRTAGNIRFFAALYAWGRTLVHHPHLHCAIPVGASPTTAAAGSPADPDSSCRSGCSHATSAASSSQRCKTPSSLDNCTSPAGCSPSPISGASPKHLRPDRQTDTRRLAISNQCLCSLDDGAVRFRHTDYRSSGASRHKTMTLAAAEFSRRMLFTCSRPASTASATMTPSPLAPASRSCPSAGGRSARRHHQRRSRTPRLLTIRIAMRS